MDMEGSGGSSSKSIKIAELVIQEVTMSSSEDEDDNFIEVAPPALHSTYLYI
jgi:hypothetical protein